MPRLSKLVKEIIKTSIVVLSIALLVFFYWVYPLNRAKAMWGRTDLDSYQPDSLLARPNSPTAFAVEGAAIDTFRIEADGSTNLAAVRIRRGDMPTPRGTIILLHTEKSDRGTTADLARQLTDSGFVVAVYDQRASGLSSGKYHSDGRMEATDLETVVAHLGLHDQLVAPVVAVGWNIGADAALLAQADETRISAVLAIEPYLSTTAFIESYQAKFASWKFPFWRTLLWFWFNARSSYGLGFVNSGDVAAVAGPATIMSGNADRGSVEVSALRAKSGSNLTFRPVETDMNKLAGIIVTLATTQPAN